MVLLDQKNRLVCKDITSVLASHSTVYSNGVSNMRVSDQCLNIGATFGIHCITLRDLMVSRDLFIYILGVRKTPLACP